MWPSLVPVRAAEKERIKPGTDSIYHAHMVTNVLTGIRRRYANNQGETVCGSYVCWVAKTQTGRHSGLPAIEGILCVPAMVPVPAIYLAGYRHHTG